MKENIENLLERRSRAVQNKNFGEAIELNDILYESLFEDYKYLLNAKENVVSTLGLNKSMKESLQILNDLKESIVKTQCGLGVLMNYHFSLLELNLIEKYGPWRD
ncbi:MAG: hypothetical protein WC438_02775 [Candidatus Pacearchaeota archaeon]